MKLWLEAAELNKQALPNNHDYSASVLVSDIMNVPSSMQQVIHQVEHLWCFVDASWASPNQACGVGWTFFDKYGQNFLRGSEAIQPIQSSMEAEVEALRMAVTDLARLGYHQVTFCGIWNNFTSSCSLAESKRSLKDGSIFQLLSMCMTFRRFLLGVASLLNRLKDLRM